MGDKITDFKDLIVWQKAHQMALAVYKFTRGFPDEEKFGLVSQMRRAAVSVPANVAEGFSRRGIRDKLNFYNIAQSSIAELEYFIILAQDLGYLKRDDKLKRDVDDIQKLLSALVRSIKEKNENAS